MELGLYCLNTVAKKAIAKHSNALKEYKNGKTGLVGLFTEEAMKMTKNLADPRALHETVIHELNKMPG